MKASGPTEMAARACLLAVALACGLSGVSLPAGAQPHEYLLFLAAADGVLPVGGQTTVTVVFTDNGIARDGAPVNLASADPIVHVIVGSGTTDAQGSATFPIQANFTNALAPVTLTARATNGTDVVTETLVVTVLAFEHGYVLSGSASPVAVGAGASAEVTFTFEDNGVPVPDANVTITISPGTAFEIIGANETLTGPTGEATFTVRSRTVAAAAAATVMGSARNGTDAPAEGGVTIVALPPPPAPPPPPGISPIAFGGTAALLVGVAALFALMWMRSRRPASSEGAPPPKPESGEPPKP